MANYIENLNELMIFHDDKPKGDTSKAYLSQFAIFDNKLLLPSEAKIKDKAKLE